ncbi:MAG: GSCFA domain-containing protein [Alloprevotella sp.]|nr:GSCFA domain-containing protein [Alloprevotella sp.]
MRFQTLVDLPPPAITLRPSSKVLFLGSCFATNVGERMAEALPHVVVNPMGTLYNPSSIALALRLLQKKEIPKTLLFEGGDGLWHSWAHASEVSDETQEACLARIHERWEQVDLAQTEVLFVTFGTARVYTLAATGQIVANCHKASSRLFCERDLSVEEMVEEWTELLSTLSENLKVVFTVSPYRYAKYGFHESQLSKARLLLAINELCHRHPQCHYFPAYEIVLDELRDYRFYASDMLHPTAQTADYIWERLQTWAFPEATQRFAKERMTLMKALQHRPRRMDDAYQQFLQQTKERLVALDATGIV